MMRASRRSVIRGVAASAIAAPAVLRWIPARASARSDLFTLGIASGDPSPDGFVIWTRLAPEPFAPRGGMPAIAVEVAWEIAADAGFRKVVRSGIALAHVELAHAVHVEITGLEPAREYFYRFRAGGVESAAGRARTLPVPGQAVSRLRFVSAGCQQWEGGLYHAWRAVAAEELDFVVHYGDYIYEHGWSDTDRFGRAVPRVMPREFSTCYTLTDYRNRYALYKSDPDLQAAHASCPFIASVDDHEVADNWAGDTDSRQTAAEAFLFRRAAALQAWYEHMPVRRALMPRGADIVAYRRMRIGDLADIAILDTRQYRSLQPCGDGFRAQCAEAAHAGRTIIGEAQERWLAEGLKQSRAPWQVIAQQVLFAPFDWRGSPWAATAEAPVHDLDAWDGATAARDRILALWRQAKVINPVVLSGDIHRGLALDLTCDPCDERSACVGVEFLATSISSGGDGSAAPPDLDQLRMNNPHLRHMSDQRGYMRYTLTPSSWTADFRTVDKVSVPGALVVTSRTLGIEAGFSGLSQV